ncbi:MAG: hypothetical protein KAX63_05880 [Pseudomonas sp.]|nr:hypothetical protein [Pseudomonas sp.]
MSDLLRGPVGWAFARLIENLFTRLSTALVDNHGKPSTYAGLPGDGEENSEKICALPAFGKVFPQGRTVTGAVVFGRPQA